jgi:hypothetical protein
MRKQQLSECIEKHPSKRALPEEEVIDSLAPALYWVRQGKPWHGLAWLGFPGYSCIGGVSQGKGGGWSWSRCVVVGVLCLYHFLPSFVETLNMPFKGPYHRNMPFNGPYHFALKKKNTLSRSMEKFSPLTAPLPPAPPRLPQKISKNQLSPGFAGWMPRLRPFRKKYGAWIEPTPVKNWNISFYCTFYRQLTNNSAKFSFICCILVWFLGVWIFHPKVVSNWMRSKPYSFFSRMGYDNFRVSSFFWYTESLLASVLTGCNGPFARALPH